MFPSRGFWLTLVDFDVCGKFDGGSSVSKIYRNFLDGYCSPLEG
jgi:hypothetical protein